MNRRLVALVAAAAALAFAAWLGFRDGREHKAAASAESRAG